MFNGSVKIIWFCNNNYNYFFLFFLVCFYFLFFNTSSSYTFNVHLKADVLLHFAFVCIYAVHFVKAFRCFFFCFFCHRIKFHLLLSLSFPLFLSLLNHLHWCSETHWPFQSALAHRLPLSVLWEEPFPCWFGLRVCVPQLGAGEDLKELVFLFCVADEWHLSFETHTHLLSRATSEGEGWHLLYMRMRCISRAIWDEWKGFLISKDRIILEMWWWMVIFIFLAVIYALFRSCLHSRHG